MGYRGKVAEQGRARELRADAWTLKEIAAELGVAVGARRRPRSEAAPVVERSGPSWGRQRPPAPKGRRDRRARGRRPTPDRHADCWFRDRRVPPAGEAVPPRPARSRSGDRVLVGA